MYITNIKINKNYLFAFVLTIGVMVLMEPYIAARAQLLTFVLFVLEILFIECFLDTKKKRYAVGLVLIEWLIANAHVAVFYFFFVLMLPYMAEYYIILLANSDFIYKIMVSRLKKNIEKVSRKNQSPEKLKILQEKLVKLDKNHAKMCERQKQRRENPYKIKFEKRDNAKWLILIAIICLATGLLTPLGNEPYTHIIKLMSGTTTQNIAEHQPLVLAQSINMVLVLVVLLGLLIFTDIKITLKDLFMLGGLIFLSFETKRQFSFLLIIGVMSLTRLLCNFVNKYDKNGTDEFVSLMVKRRGEALTIILIVICSFTIYLPKVTNAYVDDTAYPVGLADFILSEFKDARLDKDYMKMFNDYNYGSYLLYRGIPVFLDSRADLYSPEFNEGVDVFSDYMNVSNIGIYYETIFDKYAITHVATYVNSKLNMFLSRDDNYKELYKDDHFVFYERLQIDTGNYEKEE